MMIKKRQSFHVLVLCAVALIIMMTISVTVTTHHDDQSISNPLALAVNIMTTMTVHAFSPNSNAERATSHSSKHHRLGTNLNPTVIQPETVRRSTKSKTVRKSTNCKLDWEEPILTELQQRIEEGFQYEPNHLDDSYTDDDKSNNYEEEDFHNCHAVFAGYRFTVEERQRLRSAHAEDDDNTSSSSSKPPSSSYVAP